MWHQLAQRVNCLVRGKCSCDLNNFQIHIKHRYLENLLLIYPHMNFTRPLSVDPDLCRHMASLGLNWLRAEQYCRCFKDDILKGFSWLTTVVFWYKSLIIIPKGPIDYKPVLVQVTQWWSSLLTHICIRRPLGDNNNWEIIRFHFLCS